MNTTPELCRCMPQQRMPCGQHCQHDLCADCERCCTCRCAAATTTPEA